MPPTDLSTHAPWLESLRASRARRFALFVVAAVEIRRRRWEFAGARVDHLVGGTNAERPATRADVPFVFAAQRTELAIREPKSLHPAQLFGIDVVEAYSTPVSAVEVQGAPGR